MMTHIVLCYRRTHYASLPYTVRINLLSLLLRQHIMIGHTELEKFVGKLKDETGTSCSHNWEDVMLNRLQELVKPLPMNLEPVATVHLSDEVIQGITNDWITKTSTLGVATGKLYTIQRHSIMVTMPVINSIYTHVVNACLIDYLFL